MKNDKPNLKERKKLYTIYTQGLFSDKSDIVAIIMLLASERLSAEFST